MQTSWEGVWVTYFFFVGHDAAEGLNMRSDTLRTRWFACAHDTYPTQKLTNTHLIWITMRLWDQQEKWPIRSTVWELVKNRGTPAQIGTVGRCGPLLRHVPRIFTIPSWTHTTVSIKSLIASMFVLVSKAWNTVGNTTETRSSNNYSTKPTATKNSSGCFEQWPAQWPTADCVVAFGVNICARM